MGGKNASTSGHKIAGIRTSSKMLSEDMVGVTEVFAFPEYGSFVTTTNEVADAIKNNTIHELPEKARNNLEDYKVFADLLNGARTKHIHFLLWATTEGQTLIETKRNKEPILDKDGNTIPRYPEIHGEKLLSYPGVENVMGAFKDVNKLIETLPSLKNKYKPYPYAGQ